MKTPNKLIHLSTVLSLSGFILFSNQNCGMEVASQRQQPASPFEESKVLFSEQFAVTQRLADPNGNDLSDSATLPAGTELAVLVKDACIRARQASPHATPFWIDSYINSSTPLSGDGAVFSETAVGVVTRGVLTVGQLRQTALLDSCIIGLSNTTKINFRTPVSGNSTAANIMGSLRFTQADQFFAAQIPASVKVRVAILDSGLHSQNAALVSKVDPAYQNFYNLHSRISGTGSTSNYNDEFGTGTQLASLIAGDAPKNFNGFVSRNIVLLPIKIMRTNSQPVTSSTYVNAIKLAVNMQADVINLASSDATSCDPMLGHAMLQATRRNAFLVMSAGDNIEPDRRRPRRVGEVRTVKDNGPLFSGATASPGCWGRYLKGAITVSAASIDGRRLSSFSNWGADGIELAAPGESIAAIHNNGARVVSDSIELPTAMVTSAVALTIAFHKAKRWFYDPWLVEDVLINASPVKAELVSRVRLGKWLDFLSLSNYLERLQTLTPEQRLAESSDNPELNGGWNAESAVAANLISIDVYAKNPIIQTGRRIQLNTVAYYSDAVIKVITQDTTTYSSSAPTIASVNAQGVVTALRAGNASITASYQGRTATASLSIVDYDVIHGPGADLVDLDFELAGIDQNCPVGASASNQWIRLNPRAVFADGGSIPLSSTTVSFVSPGAPETISFITDSHLFTNNWYGGRTYSVIGLYRGRQKRVDVVAPRAPYRQTLLQFKDRVEGSGTLVNDGGVISIAQHKGLRLTPRIIVNDDCFHFPASGDRSLPTNQWFTSTDPALQAVLNTYTSSSQPLDLKSLQVNRNYSLTVNFGTYRGNGVQENVGTRNYTLRVTPMDVRDVHLTSWTGQQLTLDPFPRGISNMVGLQVEDETGYRTSVDPADFSVQFFNASGVRMKHSEAATGTDINDSFSTFTLALYPSTRDAQRVRMDVLHRPSGFRKQFNLNVAALNMNYAEKRTIAQFNWNNFAFPAAVAGCPQGANSPLVGQGTVESPIVVCSPQQLIEVGSRTTDLRTAPHVRIGADLNFAGLNFPLQPLSFNSLNGNSRLLQNITYANAEIQKEFIRAMRIDNLNLNAVNVSTRSLRFMTVETITNLRVSNSLFIATSGESHIIGGSRLTLTNVRLQDVEIQATGMNSPVGLSSNSIITNFGARGLRIRGSSVAGASTHAAGIMAYCAGCKIYSSSTSGEIGQVNGNAGGLIGFMAGNSEIAGSQSDMSIAASGDNVGGLAGNCSGSNEIMTTGLSQMALILNSSFTGSVRGRSSVGGLCGSAKHTHVLSSTARPTAQVQGVAKVGGIFGESYIFNVLDEVNFIGTVFSEQNAHPIATSRPLYENLRANDIYSGLRYNNTVVNINFELDPVPLPATAPIGTRYLRRP